MQENLNKVNVLYANASLIEENEDLNLQKIANDMVDFFYERGLLKSHRGDVKLHVTMINTKYRDKDTESPQKRKKRWIPRKPFDATRIMEKYKDYDFGETILDEIHLSLMSSVGDNGFYKPLSVIKIVWRNLFDFTFSSPFCWESNQFELNTLKSPKKLFDYFLKFFKECFQSFIFSFFASEVIYRSLLERVFP